MKALIVTVVPYVTVVPIMPAVTFCANNVTKTLILVPTCDNYFGGRK